MLPRRLRITRPEEYRLIFQEGRKYRGQSLQLFALPAPDGTSRFGFLVSKKVGNAVTRNLVKRRLRAASAPLLSNTEATLWFVARAFPQAADTTFDQLNTELKTLVQRAGQQQ